MSHRPISQIPQCIIQVSHNAPFCNRNVHRYAHFCYQMEHYGIRNWCIVGFVQPIYLPATQTQQNITLSESCAHFRMTSSNGNISRVTGHLCGEFTDPRWIPRTKASDAELWCFSLICVWINGWVNNREAGDFRRYRAHYDVIVMFLVNLQILTPLYNCQPALWTRIFLVVCVWMDNNVCINMFPGEEVSLLILDIYIWWFLYKYKKMNPELNYCLEIFLDFLLCYGFEDANPPHMSTREGWGVPIWVEIHIPLWLPIYGIHLGCGVENKILNKFRYVRDVGQGGFSNGLLAPLQKYISQNKICCINCTEMQRTSTKILFKMVEKYRPGGPWFPWLSYCAYIEHTNAVSI